VSEIIVYNHDPLGPSAVLCRFVTQHLNHRLQITRRFWNWN